MPRRLAQPCPLPLYSLPAHAVVYWCVLGPRPITFEVGRGVELYDAAVSGTTVSAPHAPHCLHTLLFTLVELLDTALSDPFPGGGFGCTMRRCLAWQCPLSRR